MENKNAARTEGLTRGTYGGGLAPQTALPYWGESSTRTPTRARACSRWMRVGDARSRHSLRGYAPLARSRACTLPYAGDAGGLGSSPWKIVKPGECGRPFRPGAHAMFPVCTTRRLDEPPRDWARNRTRRSRHHPCVGPSEGRRPSGNGSTRGLPPLPANEKSEAVAGMQFKA